MKFLPIKGFQPSLAYQPRLIRFWLVKKVSWLFFNCLTSPNFWTFIDSDKIIDSLMRAKGFHLDAKNTMTSHVNSNLVQNYVLALQSGKKISTDVLQKRFKIDSRNKHIKSTVLTKQFCNNLSSKRFFKASKSKTRLFPYGLTNWDDRITISDRLFEKELNNRWRVSSFPMEWWYSDLVRTYFIFDI